MNKIKKILVPLLILMTLLSCSSQNKYEEAFNLFKENWISNDYSSMYDLLTADSKNYIDKDTFMSKYTKIYEDLEITDIQIAVNGDIVDNTDFYTIPFTLKASTISGEIEISDYKANIYKEDKEYKIQWSEALIFPNMLAGDKIQINDFYASRGKILDKHGNVLAEDGEINVIGIHPAVFDIENRDSKIKELATTLDISENTIISKLDSNSDPSHFVPIVDILPTDEKLSKLFNREADGILINSKSSRVYYGGEAFGRLIGYIDTITAEDLNSDKNKDKGYTLTSLIGQSGIEEVYEDTLRGKDGHEIYLDRNGEFITIAKSNAVNGTDITLSIDSELQKKSYMELNGENGSVTAVDPKTGEVLALVSTPSYDSNIFSTYITKSKLLEWESTNYTHQTNRFSSAYSPGSTMKLLTAAIGLNTGILNPDEAFNIEGSAWQKDTSWGSFNITRVIDPNTPVTLREAAKFSDNIYFGQVALKLGSDKFIEGVKKFGIGEKLPLDYPFAQSSISNDGNISSDILLADTGYGQGEIMVTPLNMALAYSSLANNGNIMIPRLIISDSINASIWKESAISSENVPLLVDDFSALINDEDGTAVAARIPGINLAAKTGTAEIKTSQDDVNGTENGWFVAVDTTTSKISVAMFIENVKDRGGSTIPIPKVKNIIESYVK